MTTKLTLLLESILDEGKLDDFYNKQKDKFPDLIKRIDFLQNKQVPIKYFDWIYKQITTTQEPIADVVSLVQSFEKNQGKLAKRNINQYKNTGELQQSLEDLDKSKEQEQSKTIMSSNIQDVLVSKDGWFVTFPHTTEASCDLGKGTTWCTARTQSGNMFLNYVGRNQNIILFYVINPSLNPRKDPNAKMSIGYVHGEPNFNMGENNITVKADNSNLTIEDFQQIVGAENATLFLDTMSKKAEELEGIHPAQKELMAIAQDYDLFLKKVATYKDTPQNYEAKKDFFELLTELMDEDNDTSITIPPIREYIAKFENDLEYRNSVAQGFYLKLNTPEMLDTLSNDLDYQVRQSVAKNKVTSPETLLKLSKDSNDNVKRFVASNPNSPKDALINVSKTHNKQIQYQLLKNSKLPQEILDEYADNKEDGNIRVDVAKHPNTSPETLLKLAHDRSYLVLEAVVWNKNTPYEAFRILAQSRQHAIDTLLSRHEGTPSETLDMLAKKPQDPLTMKNIISNNNTSNETLKYLINKPIESYLTLVARNYEEQIKKDALEMYNFRMANPDAKNIVFQESIKQRNINNFLKILNYKNQNLRK